MIKLARYVKRLAFVVQHTFAERKTTNSGREHCSYVAVRSANVRSTRGRSEP